MAKHSHNWQLTRTVKTKNKDGSTTVFKFFECVNSGCPNPHRNETKTTK